MKISIALTVMGALAVAPSLAFAQARTRATSTECGEAVERCETVRENGRDVTRCQVTFIICGEVARPYSFGLTGRAPLGYTAMDDRRTFLPAVTGAVRREPF